MTDPSDSYEAYASQPKLAPLVRELAWSHNLLILGGCKRPEAREFYLRLAIRERWPKRELERQMDGCLFERAILQGLPRRKPRARR